MEQRMSIVTLGVADLKRSREFYERIGWRRSMAETEGIVFFQAGGMALALFPRSELARDANVPDSVSAFSGFSLAYNARNREEADSVLAEAVAAGAKLLKPAETAFWGGYSGISLTLADSCGRSPGIRSSRSQATEASRFPPSSLSRRVLTRQR